MIYAKNLPTWERVLRILVGCAVIVGAWFAALPPIILSAGLALGATLAITSLFGFCPACAVIGRRKVGR